VRGVTEAGSVEPYPAGEGHAEQDGEEIVRDRGAPGGDQERALPARAEPAEEHAREEQRRAQEAEQRQRQYAASRAARLEQLRATMRPEVLAAIEQAAAAQFEQEHTSPFGRDTLRKYALDDAVAAYFQLPDFAAWQAVQGQG